MSTQIQNETGHLTNEEMHAATTSAVAEAPAEETQVSELARLTEIARKGTEGHLNAGYALAEIKEKELYKANHETVFDFAFEVIGIGEQQVRNLIKASQIHKGLMAYVKSEGLDEAIIPGREGPLRPLGKLKLAGEQYEVLQLLHEEHGGKLTRKQIDEAVIAKLGNGDVPEKKVGLKERHVSALEDVSEALGILSGIEAAIRFGATDKDAMEAEFVKLRSLLGNIK